MQDIFDKFRLNRFTMKGCADTFNASEEEARRKKKEQEKIKLQEEIQRLVKDTYNQIRLAAMVGGYNVIIDSPGPEHTASIKEVFGNFTISVTTEKYDNIQVDHIQIRWD